MIMVALVRSWQDLAKILASIPMHLGKRAKIRVTGRIHGRYSTGVGSIPGNRNYFTKLHFVKTVKVSFGIRTLLSRNFNYVY